MTRRVAIVNSMGRRGSLCLFVVFFVSLIACKEEATPSGSFDGAVGDSPGLVFQDSLNVDVSLDTLSSEDDGSILRDLDVRDGVVLDTPAADIFPPDILPPDILPPDILPPDTLSHRCTTAKEFNCQPSSTWVLCLGNCVDHHKRKLGITCFSAACLCLVNGKSRKSCTNKLKGCSACDAALTCCDFENL